MRNHVLTFGLFFETAVACLLSYTPGMDKDARAENQVNVRE